MLDEILTNIQKPGRYIGEEWNASKKDFSQARVKFALCFPDLYEVGMSNLGIRIIYGLLNNLDTVVCERFFAPGLDLEQALRANNAEIFSLESKSKLREFDLVGFSLGHELNYTNVLNILELGNIPLEASLRSEKHPLVIGGGPCALNPEPMHEFFDLFVIGEAEEVIVEIIHLYEKNKEAFKQGILSREDLLTILSGIEGIYVPSLYEVAYADGGKVREFKPRRKDIPLKIKKRFVKDLDKAYFPAKWLVPYIQIIHDRITLEVMRGCPNQCRFCQARAQYYPFRYRSIANILKLAQEAYCLSGYEELSLAGLSVSDYPGFEELLKSLMRYFDPKSVNLSLPAIKPQKTLGDISRLIAGVKKTSLTFAPEAATEKLRKILNKNFAFPEFCQAIEQAYASGYQHIKLYFMIGLPREELSDLDEIIHFSHDASELRRKATRGAPAQINISINTLIPKPHTAFQWSGMLGLEEMKAKQDYLKKIAGSKRKLKINFHNFSMSFLEGVLSRADRRLSRVIYLAFKAGARFDAWENYFLFQKWQDAFNAAGIDPNFYLQAKEKEEILPWDFLEIGVDKNLLLKEAEEINLLP